MACFVQKRATEAPKSRKKHVGTGCSKKKYVGSNCNRNVHGRKQWVFPEISHFCLALEKGGIIGRGGRHHEAPWGTRLLWPQVHGAYPHEISGGPPLDRRPFRCWKPLTFESLEALRSVAQKQSKGERKGWSSPSTVAPVGGV